MLVGHEADSFNLREKTLVHHGEFKLPFEVGAHPQAADHDLGLDLPGEPEAWYGFRPLTPDSRPIIGPLRRIPNLILATGHGQLGMTLAPITGDLVSAMVRGEAPALDPSPFLPARFGL